jgi:Polysaccharide pyruvyl transferase
VRRAVVLEGNPFIYEYYRKDAATLLRETGGNTGNLAFRFAVVNHLVDPTIMPWDAPIQEIRAAGDIIVLPLANQLGGHTDLGREAHKLSQIGLPVVGLGLGAQAASLDQDIVLKDGTLAWLAAITSHAPADHPNIGVRGNYTAAQIAKVGWPNASTVTGCPSNFINTQDDIASAVTSGFKRNIRRIAVAAGIPYISSLAGIERSLADIVSLTDGAYIVQHDLEMIRLARGEFDVLGSDTFLLCKNYISPGSTNDEFKAWLRRYAHAFFDVRAWMDFVRRFDFVVGTRFHGVMLAIQAGVPAGCIAHDSRTLEMCQTMNIPVCRHSDINGTLDRRNLLDYFTFDPVRYRETRAALCENYVNLLVRADIAVRDTLTNIVSQ